MKRAKRLVVELHTEEEIDIFLQFKSRCARMGKDMREVMIDIIKNYLVT